MLSTRSLLRNLSLSLSLSLSLFPRWVADSLACWLPKIPGHKIQIELEIEVLRTDEQTKTPARNSENRNSSCFFILDGGIEVLLVSQGWAIKSIYSCSDGLQIVIFSKGVRVRESLYRALCTRDYFVGLSPTKLFTFVPTGIIMQPQLVYVWREERKRRLSYYR